ncbi:N-acetylmuramoyl-L-alanine amidase [Sphingomonas canadensis]|uniref:N-acetylmuramoyl-L-alanine amidase n=1 Tax=Sphingomonas canadensis TaxID=1219257 RepID=A0ABW3H0G5_9SPHN|nr:N-acetylmuramoyl-L-alanine amidase [Sphingomonas canadensis]MCW3835190.1 N-acetylmuramoyl-L-alanine amidase [Sphingomonas canadensis]
MHLGWTPRQPARHIARVLFLLALLSGWLTGVPSWAGAVQEISVKGDRVVIRFDEPVARASAFVLAGPDRIAVDVAGAAPGGSVRAGGSVTRVRQGVQDGGNARIVLDLARPAIVTEGRFGKDGTTLTLALRPVDNASFARAAAEGRMSFLPPFSYFQPVQRSRYSERVNVPPRVAPAALPRIYGNDASRPLVVIDAGHGGHDPGAIGPNGLREKDLTLRVALAIRDELLKSGRVRVALTREDDRFLILQERFGLARKLGASLFISVHCDSATSAEASGATVYTLSEVASDKEAARLAARENKADILAGVDLGGTSPDISSILIDLTQRETMNMSASFARLLGREAMPLIPIKDNFHRMASLMVLKAPDMPSVLFETGYISNASDARFLASEEGQRRVAATVRRAVEIHFATRMASR